MTGPLPRLPLAGLALAAVTGIVLATVFTPEARWLVVLVAGALAFSFGRGGTPALWVATAGLFALAHIWQWNENPDRVWAEGLGSEPRYATVTGVLVDQPQESVPGQWRGRLRVESWTLDGTTVTRPSVVAVRWRTKATPAYGDRWTISGTLTTFSSPRNPGQFDAALWYARQGVFLEVRNRDDTETRLLARDQGAPVRAAALVTRAWIMHTLSLGLEGRPEIQAVIAGITLGAREEAAESFTPAFRQTGTLHLFAVSGLHVGMFGLLLWLALRSIGLSRRQAVLLIIPALFFYSLVTGAKPSSLRAATMISIALGGFLLDRAPAPGNSLAAAALVLLGWDTNQLFQPGFQLSFCVVSSIILLAPALDRWLTVRLRPDEFLPPKLYSRFQRAQAEAGRYAAAALAVATASWLGSLPLTIGLFHLVPVLAVPVNLLAVPLAFCVLSLAMLSLLGGTVSAFVATTFNHLNSVLTAGLLALVQSAAALPGSWFHLPPGWMQPPARLTVFDLSTGGAQLLRTPRAAWLVDTGTTYDYRAILRPALRAAGVGTLDGMIVTHGDTEHVGGALELWQEHPPRRLLDSVLRDRSPARRQLHAAWREAGLPKTLVLPGDRWRAGRDTSVTILAPAAADKARRADDQSIVTAVQHGAFRVLLMSDAGAATEEKLLRRNAEALPADIVYFGRHGDDVFATSEFLAAVQPRAIILAPADPFRDGRREPALRQRLAATGAEIFDQDACGAVIMTFRSGRAELAGFLNDQKLTLEPH